MWKRKELKNKAKKVVKNNYWTAIVVCFLIALLTGEFGTSIIGIWQWEDSVDPNYILSQESIILNEETVKEEIEEMEEEKSSLSDTQLMLLKIVEANINNLIKSEKYIFRIWDAIELFGIKQTSLGVGLILIAIIAIVYIILLAEPLTVACKRYFIEARENNNTKIGVMKETFKKGNWKNIVKIMLIKNLYNILWCFTIIGGVIKFYEYKMIPYILADNPNIDKKEVFKLSKEMMRHNKWKTFILDLSFILWGILSLFTFGFLNILYVNPYRAATITELYITLKNKAIEDEFEYSSKLIKEE